MLACFLVVGCGLDLPDVSERYEVMGVDVSRYQGVVDWEKVAAGGHEFAFIKASEGHSLRDEFFTANWDAAGRAGLLRGAYHFYRPSVSVERQFSNFAAVASLQPGDLPPVLDVEEKGELTARQLARNITRFAKLVELKYGVSPIIYTGQNFYNRNLAGQLDDYPLWLAKYDWYAPVTVCGRNFQFWQYTDEGRVVGIVGDVDRNVFTGSLAQLQRLCIPARPTEADLARFKD